MGIDSESVKLGPCAVLGAGELVSQLFCESESPENRYRFNLFRVNPQNGQTESWFQPSDLQSLVKVCQVLAFAIADDGWVSPDLRDALVRLNAELDELTQNWSAMSHG